LEGIETVVSVDPAAVVDELLVLLEQAAPVIAKVARANVTVACFMRRVETCMGEPPGWIDGYGLPTSAECGLCHTDTRAEAHWGYFMKVLAATGHQGRAVEVIVSTARQTEPDAPSLYG